MTTLDAKILPKVLSVIKQYGVDAVFGTEPTGYDVSIGGTNDSATSAPTKVSPPANGKYSDRETGLTKITGYVILPGLNSPVVPKKGMTVQVNALSVTLMDVEPFYSGTEVAAWRLWFDGPIQS